MKIDKLIENCYNQLPPQWRDAPWRYLNHGFDVLDSEDKLNAYIASYGEMHVAKCKKAMQNFPFDSLISRNKANTEGELIPLEIFDWGCGQGLGVLTFLQFLFEREMLDGVKRITLIEPSPYALARAKDWVRQAVNPHTKVDVIERKIPGSGNERWENLKCTSRICIHIFSNILDVNGVSLKWLSSTCSLLGEENYYICVGPQYKRGLSRIEDFFNHFISPEPINSINQYPCGYTAKTHHPYGLEAKCFFHKSERGTLTPLSFSDQKYTDVYQDDEEALRGYLPDNVNAAYQVIKNKIKGIFTIYLCPSLGVERPDFLLNDSQRGIVLVNVCDDVSEFSEEYQKIEDIKRSLFDTYVKSLKVNTILNPSVYNSVKTALYFPNAGKEEVEQQCKEYYSKVCEETNSYYKGKPTDSTKFLLKLFPSTAGDDLQRVMSKGFKYEFYEEINKLLLGEWHSYSQGVSTFMLTDKQKKIIKNSSDRLRVKGVAGSGKTHTLAYKAVEEHLRTGEKVLIVTYNISLIEYIRMRINQVAADFSTSSFDIINYHKFFWSKASRYGCQPLNLESPNIPDFFERDKEAIKNKNDRYSTIIVDEVQDYEPVWIDNLQKYFLKENGRFILFGDGEQNIYKRAQEKMHRMPVTPGFTGSWNELSERISKRMLNQQLNTLASEFSYKFGLSDKPLVISSELPLEDYIVRYWKVNAVKDALPLAKNVCWILQHYNLDSKDVVVLGQSVDLLREMEYYYKHITNQHTMTTFESREEYYQIKNKVGDNAGRMLRDLKDIRRVAKVHFTTDSPYLKFATIPSFKGWEAQTVILFIQKEGEKSNDKEISKSGNRFEIQAHGNEDALIYTGITRARENLFIINMSNEKYDAFFNTKKYND